MAENTLDAPAKSIDKAPPAEQASEESWMSKIYSNIQKEAAGRTPASPATFEGLRLPSPTMTAMENTGALPVCRTSC
jgi:hypothetical protein